MLDQLIELDHQLFLYLNNLGIKKFDFFWIIMSNKILNFICYSIILYLIYLKRGFKTSTFILISTIFLILLSDQTSNFFKYYFERLRPCHDINFADLIRIPGNYCGGKYGFFSAHSSNSFALSTFFGFIFLKSNKYILPLLYLFSFLIAYSRIYLGVHFPLDIIFGGFFGVLLGWCFYNFCSWFYKKNTNSIIDF